MWDSSIHMSPNNHALNVVKQKKSKALCLVSVFILRYQQQRGGADYVSEPKENAQEMI